MAAYLISELEALDAELFEKYKSLAQAAIAKYGGRYLARGASIETAEGAPSEKHVVIVEFPSMGALHRWYGSPEYSEARTMSPRAMKRRLIFVDGVPKK